MIQFNLLPDVKIEFIKTRHTKRLVTTSAIGVIGISIAIISILFIIVFGWQNNNLKTLDKNIKTYANDLRSEKDINKVLTVQNQLSSIDTLHTQKPDVARVFEYLTQVTPSKITVATLSVDFVTPVFSVTGQASSLEEVNKYVDTLKFTTINNKSEESSDGEGEKAFSQVVLSAYSLDSQGASFTITLVYEAKIFDSSEADLILTVPQITSTRSETERPTGLFKENVTPLEDE